MERAGIPRGTEETKIDFHALRNTYITCLFETGATLKEAQHLARHQSPELTANVYAKTRPDRLKNVVNRLGQSRGQTAKTMQIICRKENRTKTHKPQAVVTQRPAVIMMWWRRRESSPAGPPVTHPTINRPPTYNPFLCRNICPIAQGRGINEDDLTVHIRDAYGVGRPEDLSVSEASS